jgi:hypothetical protein
MTGDRVVIDRKYVHKFNSDNVFLCNLRRTLPQSIEKDLFEKTIKNSVSTEEYNLLTKFYELNTLVDRAQGKNKPSDEYILCFVPAIQTLPEEIYNILLTEKKYSWEKELLEKLYTRDMTGSNIRYCLKEDISEPYDNFIITSFNAWDLFITTEDRTIISALLEKIPEVPRREIYYANMFVNTEHPFFFEHPNEHVPGIMLIETIRQFIVACGHVYGKIPMDGTQLILNSLECQFMSYVNINYPILLRGTAYDYKFNRDGYWHHVTLRTEVMQNGRCMALFDLKGTCLSSGIFERIRRNQLAEMKRSRFIPCFNGQYILELSPENVKTRLRADLVNLSLEGMSVKMDYDKFSPNCDSYDIYLSVNNGKEIKGKYKKIWHSMNKDQVVIGLRNTKMGEDDLEKLHSLISHDCMAIEERQLT